jgi:hypothetical protein
LLPLIRSLVFTRFKDNYPIRELLLPFNYQPYQRQSSAILQHIGGFSSQLKPAITAPPKLVIREYCLLVRIPRCLQRGMNSNLAAFNFIGEYHEST